MDALIDRLKECEGHSPGHWQIRCDFDVTGYPMLQICGFAGDQKRDATMHAANSGLTALAPELKDAYLSAMQENARLRRLIVRIADGWDSDRGIRVGFTDLMDEAAQIAQEESSNGLAQAEQE